MHALSRRSLRHVSWRRALSSTPTKSPAKALLPDETVSALGKHIVGQHEAKVAVAIALRDQWRRQQLSDDLQHEVLPNNILMVGPTGVGKTEVARRLALLAGAPFVKVEATKYTEVGVYGADTESMVEDLVEAASQLVEERVREEKRPEARELAVARIVRALGLPETDGRKLKSLKKKVSGGKMDDDEVELSMPAAKRGGGGRGGGRGLPMMPGMPKGLADILKDISKGKGPMPFTGAQGGMPGIVVDLGEVGSNKYGSFDHDTPPSEATEKTSVGEALARWEDAELDELVEGVDLDEEAVKHAQERGIIFVDEIDKLVRRSNEGGGGAFYKGEGVQKELLALVEGTKVRTRRGLASTSHMLFICAGAFHMAKPADLLPELQGRLPVRVELKTLTEADFVRILTDTKFNLLMQQQRLLETEGVQLTFTDDAVAEIASLAARVNTSVENIGARRLRTVIAKLMEDVSFNANRLSGTEVVVDAAYVRAHTGTMSDKVDMQKYIL